MSNIPENLKFTKTHEWVRDEGHGVVVIGITDHAQQLLGDLVFAELPEVEEEFFQGDDLCVLESVKAAADVYAPVSGAVLEVNEALMDAPELINQAPYTEGWILKLEVNDPDSLNALLDSASYQKHIASEQH